MGRARHQRAGSPLPQQQCGAQPRDQQNYRRYGLTEIPAGAAGGFTQWCGRGHRSGRGRWRDHWWRRVGECWSSIRYWRIRTNRKELRRFPNEDRSGGLRLLSLQFHRQLYHYPVRRLVELLLHEDFIDSGVLQGAGPVPIGYQCAHQRHRYPRIEWILSRDLPPPAHRFGPVAALLRTLRQLLQRLGVAACQGGAFLFRPPLELRRRRQVEAIEERAGVARGGVFQAPALNGRLEPRHVAGDQIGIEPQVAAAEKDVVRAEVLAQGVERLIQPPAGPLLLGIGPEVGQHFFAGEPLLAGGRQERENGQTAGLCRRSTDYSTFTANVESPEGIYL